ncbi:hypothetical protein TWF281_004777 [Arthrobotrys megalospora]
MQSVRAAGATECVLHIPELLTEILYNVGLPKVLTAASKVDAFKSLSKCLRVSRQWNATIISTKKIRQRLFKEDAFIDHSNTEVEVCEPFVQELTRWTELREFYNDGPSDYLQKERFPDVYFTHPVVKEVSLTITTIHGLRVNPMPLWHYSPTKWSYWNRGSMTYRLVSRKGVKAMDVAKLLQKLEIFMGKGHILGVAIGVPDLESQSDGLPVWVDFDMLALESIEEQTSDMHPILRRHLLTR